MSPPLAVGRAPPAGINDAFTAAGYRIAVISEAPFSPDTPRELLPPDLGDATAFNFFVLDAP